MKNTKITNYKLLGQIVNAVKTSSRARRMLSLVFIFALFFVPLLTIENAMRQAEAATKDSLAEMSARHTAALGADSIFQICEFGCGQVQVDL